MRRNVLGGYNVFVLLTYIGTCDEGFPGPLWIVRGNTTGGGVTVYLMYISSQHDGHNDHHVYQEFSKQVYT